MAKRVWRRLDREVRTQIIRLGAKGWSQEQIAREVSRSIGSVGNGLRPLGGVWRGDMLRAGSDARLSIDERVEICIGLGGGAHRRACGRLRRPKPTRLGENPRLLARVVTDLEALGSPEQIAQRLRYEFPDEPEMWVSHETIYKSLYVQGRGELRRELAACLRTGRARPRPRGRIEQRGRIPGMVNISERPAEIEDRAVPGHWEGDLIIGKDGLSAIGTLVERSTRYVMLLHLPEGRTAAEVRTAMTNAVKTLPAKFARSVTWDQGSEMAEHATFTIDTGIDVYFCDPHSPWQRGSNENTNGLLRQYFPKSTDLSIHTAATLQAVADSLNNRPRKTLGWKTPSEKLAELFATTD